jgi:hypothetical protein
MFTPGGVESIAIIASEPVQLIADHAIPAIPPSPTKRSPSR